MILDKFHLLNLPHKILFPLPMVPQFRLLGEGSLSLTNTLNLDSVLVVPSLNYNLLSVSQITTALFCGLNFVYLRTSGQGRRLVVVLGEGSCITGLGV